MAHVSKILKQLKMLCLYLLGQNFVYILHFNLAVKTTPVDMRNRQNIVIHACKNITGKMNLLKLCGPQIRLCLFTFRPMPEQLNSLTTIDTLS